MMSSAQQRGDDAARLSLSGVEAWYGESHVLHGMTLDVRRGEIVTLLGRNGAGKTATLKAIMGMIAERKGRILYQGNDIIDMRADGIARSGIALCPEERGIFASLTVTENLMLPPVVASGGGGLDEIYRLFPNLKERAASQGTRLSGGEQQMLAIARILRTGARFLLLDEPTEGLAPVIVQQIGRLLHVIRDRGITALLVEQNFRFAQTVADRHYVVEHGRVIDMIPNDQMERNTDKMRGYLGV